MLNKHLGLRATRTDLSNNTPMASSLISSPYNPFRNFNSVFTKKKAPDRPAVEGNSMDATLDKVEEKISNVLSSYDKSLHRFLTIVFIISKKLGRIVFSAILFFVLAYLCPPLREKLPDFYAIIDFILGAFNQLCDFLIDLFS